VTAGRGVGGTYMLPEHKGAVADEFGGKSDALMLGNSVSWAKNPKRTHILRGPRRVS